MRQAVHFGERRRPAPPSGHPSRMCWAAGWGRGPVPAFPNGP